MKPVNPSSSGVVLWLCGARSFVTSGPFHGKRDYAPTITYNRCSSAYVSDVTKRVNVTSLIEKMTSTSDYVLRGRLAFYAFSLATGRLGSPKV